MAINIALIGAGGMANGVHYPSLAEFDDVNLVGLCDFIPVETGSDSRTIPDRKHLQRLQRDARKNQP